MMLRFFSSLFLSITTLFLGLTHNTASIISNVTGHAGVTSQSTRQVILTHDQLLALASNPYADGILPLGDKKYVTDGPKKGYIYLCNANNGNGGGAQAAGNWIHGNTWNSKEKISVSGEVKWPTAKFSNTLSGDSRTLSGNDLPSHTTGIFPIQSSDPAYKYDRNPNSLSDQSFSDTFPVAPTYSDTPNCMGGEAGIMTTGVALFNGFDAEYRDAAAYEVQDSCSGHPEKTGEYHYHSLSRCITDVNETSVIGFALDGFPITGPKVADGKYLVTENLDECHGITSEINLDGKKVAIYHYVMTQDFPYSVSCFRGKPVSLQVLSNHMGGQNGGQRQGGQTGVQNGMRPQPPQEAYSACSGKSAGTSCSFTAPRGTVTGTCQTLPGQTRVVCAPTMPEQNQGKTLNY